MVVCCILEVDVEKKNRDNISSFVNLYAAIKRGMIIMV